MPKNAPRVATAAHLKNALDHGTVILAGKLIDVNENKGEALLDTPEGSRISVMLREGSELKSNVGNVVEIIAEIRESVKGNTYSEIISSVHSASWDPEAYKASVDVAHKHPELFGW